MFECTFRFDKDIILECDKSIKKANCRSRTEYIVRSANQDNPYAEYALGKLYLYGKDVPKDIEKALYYLNRSTEHENLYAKQLLDKYENTPFPSSFGTVMGLFQQLAGLFKSKMDLRRYENRM